VTTANRRASALACGLSFRVVFPIADGTIDAGDRRQTTWVYRNIPDDGAGGGAGGSRRRMLTGVGR
jgi:hypothetical protein